jgi:hypothetical protein
MVLDYEFKTIFHETTLTALILTLGVTIYKLLLG